MPTTCFPPRRATRGFCLHHTLENTVLRLALEHPSCLTLVYSRMQHHYRLHCHYLGGTMRRCSSAEAAAGQHTKTGTVAYVTPKLSYTRFTSDINALALGVHSACPDARVLMVTRDVDPQADGDLRAGRQARRKPRRGHGAHTALFHIVAGGAAVWRSPR